jgi:hypothetical protein
MRIFNAVGPQKIWQGFFVELRVLPGTRDSAYIQDMRNRIYFQQAGKFVQWMS